MTNYSENQYSILKDNIPTRSCATKRNYHLSEY